MKISDKIKGEIIDWIEVIIISAIIVFISNNYVIANQIVPTGSMESTIMAGSKVVGSRLTYKLGDVDRGDVVQFVYGYTCKNDGEIYRENDEHACPICGRADKDNTEVYYLKRVIGLPGDHVEIKQTGTCKSSEIKSIHIKDGIDVPVGTLYINGQAIEEMYLTEPMIVDGYKYPEIDIVVPEGHYYMLGDNRNNSFDARYWGKYNMVSKDKLVSKIVFKYWPLNNVGLVH